MAQIELDAIDRNIPIALQVYARLPNDVAIGLRSA